MAGKTIGESGSGMEKPLIIYNSDPLLDGSEMKVEEQPDTLNQQACYQLFIGLTPFEFDDKSFVLATKHLIGSEFMKAAYRVFLKRECEFGKPPDPGDGFLTRMQIVENFRESKEFQVKWAEQISRNRSSWKVFLQKLWYSSFANTVRKIWRDASGN